MDVISEDGVTIPFDDVSYSPALTDLHEMAGDEEGTATVSIPFSAWKIAVYRTFLYTGIIPVPFSYVSDIFGYMRHFNDMNYPEEYWMIKLHDNWVRDHMYKLNLYDDPFYDLKEVPIVRTVPKGILEALGDGIYIAGGYALYLSGNTNMEGDEYRPGDHHDIDFFTTNEAAVATLLTRKGILARYHDHVVDMPTTNFGTYGQNDWKPSFSIPYKAQIILRLYKAPTEIVHGFDVDSCGILLSIDDGTPRLWATKRTIWSISNRINWLDPDRASPSYAYRLAKYMTRGYTLALPLLQQDEITRVRKRILQISLDIRREFVLYIVSLGPGDTIFEYINQHVLDVQEEQSIHDPNVTDAYNQMIQIPSLRLNREERQMLKKAILTYGNKILDTPFQASVLVTEKQQDIVNRIIPSDPASIVLLASIGSLYTSASRHFDYSNDVPKMLWNRYDTVNPKDLKWITQDPMAQVSSTIHSTPIRNLRAWYYTSPLIQQ